MWCECIVFFIGKEVTNGERRTNLYDIIQRVVRAPVVLITVLVSESEVSITVLYQLCSTRYKKCLKIVSVIKVATMKNMDGAVHPSYRLKLKYPLRFSVNYVQLATQQYRSRTV